MSAPPPAKRVRETSPKKTVRVLTQEDALAALRASSLQNNTPVLAFYSSVLDGVTLDPAFQTLPIDDHQVHRGHAVFDTCNVVNGSAYGLTFHLDRLLLSAKMARILPEDWSQEATLEERQRLRGLVLATVAATKERNDVYVRFWLSAGRGDFSIVPPHQGDKPNFFVACHRAWPKQEDKASGIAEALVSTSLVPPKPSLLATMKSTNYLINALLAMKGKELGGSLGLQYDEAQGCIGETSIGSVAVVGPDGVCRTPPLDLVLKSTTLMRAMAVWKSSKAPIKDFVFTKVTKQHLEEAVEVLALGGAHCVPIVSLDGRRVGDGRPGPVFRALNEALMSEMLVGEFVDPVPYEEQD